MTYIKTYFTGFAIIILSIATINWFVDPFGMFWSPQIEGVNLIKPEAGKRSRITKAYQVNNIAPQVLIVGNSRVEMGLDPNSEIFSKKTVYNQGIPGASVAMQVDYAIDAIHNNNTIEQLIVGVDFLDFLLSDTQIISFKKQDPSTFSAQRKASYDFRLTSKSTNNFASITRFKEQAALIFSLDAFSASINTVFQQKSMASSINPQGFNNALSYVSIMNSEGIKPLFEQKLTEISTRLTNNQWSVKALDTFPYSPTFTHLGRLIDLAKHREIPVTFFINPYHFSYIYTLVDNNQWHNFNEWKETLVHYLNVKQDKNFVLWDFSGSSSFVNEAVPLANPKQQMKWFWEPAHYRKELGEILLDNLLKEPTVPNIPFGQRLTVENITRLIVKEQASLKSNQEAWQNLQTFLKK